MTDFEAKFAERRIAAIEKRLGPPTESRIAR